MGNDNPDRGTTDKLKGKAKEVGGALTGNRKKEAEGKGEQVKGTAKEKGNEALDELEDDADD